MLRIFLATLLISLLLVNTVFGGTDIKSTREQENAVEAITERQVRGEFLALGVLKMSNMGKGKIGIFAQTLAHETVDKIRMRVYLDIYNEKISQWETVATYDFTYLSEDYDENLTSSIEDFYVQGKSNNYYRVRGMHMVWANGITESFKTETDALLITSD